MNKAWKYLAGSILNGAEPQEADDRKLDSLIAEHPYYAGLHYLKAVSLDGTLTSEAARSKAGLYFQDPHWFRALLDDTESVPVSESSISEVLSTPDAVLVEMDIPVGSEEPVTSAEPQSTVELADQAFDDKRVEEPSHELHWQGALAENPSYQQVPGSDEEAFEHNIWQHQEPATPERVVPDTEEPVPASMDAGTPERSLDMVRETADDLVPETEAVVDPVPEPQVEEPVIPFEPLHTIDYFASQGIKYNLDAGKDQLSLKLKSFTEWLKSMKRIHPEKVEAGVADESVIRENAETSNEAEEVYTEAMAEVYLKQGLTEKAREVFQKLSLLDPSKSAYFAVRIKEIKEN